MLPKEGNLKPFFFWVCHLNPNLKPLFLLQIVVDVVEIGESRRKIGEVLKVKPLAALAMIDEGELDWKIVAISLDDPKASLVNDIDDVEKHFPVCTAC